MSNMFEDILNATVVHIYTGQRVIEKNILQFQRVDPKTIFTRVEDVGIVIFEDGKPIVKKGELQISLCSSSFEPEVSNKHLHKIKELHQRIQNSKQRIAQNNGSIKMLQQQIDNDLHGISQWELEIEEIRIEINKQRTVSQA